MATVIDTLITQFRWDVDASGIDKADRKLQEFKASARKVAMLVVGLLGGSLLLNRIANTADDMLKFADSVGIAIEELGELEFVAKRNNVSVGSLRGTIMSLNRMLAETARGVGGGIEAFKRYGLTARDSAGRTKTATNFIRELNERFQTLSKQQQIDLASKLGIDASTMRILQTAPKEFGSLIRQARKFGVTSREQAMAAAKFNDSLTNIWQSLSFIGITLANKVFGPLGKLIDWFAEAVAVGSKNEQMFIRLIKVITGLRVAFALLKIKATLAWIATFAPIVAGAAAIAALVLVVEDLWTAFEGGDSVIKDLWDNANAGADKYFDKMAKESPVMFETISKTVEDIEKLFETALDGLDNLVDTVVGSITKKFSAIMKVARAIGLLVSSAPPATVGAGAGPGASIGASGITNNKRTNNFNGDINISTGTGAAGIVSAVRSGIVNMFKSGAEDFDNDIAR